MKTAQLSLHKIESLNSDECEGIIFPDTTFGLTLTIPELSLLELILKVYELGLAATLRWNSLKLLSSFS